MTNSTKRMTAVIAAMAMLAAACSGGGSSSDTLPTSPSTTGPGGATNTPVGGGSGGGSTSPTGTTPSTAVAAGQLGFRLSEGQAEVIDAEPVAVADGTALSADEVAAVLDRLPAWELPDGDVQDFNRPVATLGPPLVGETIEAPFPPPIDGPTAPPEVADGPLEVLRFQPEGPVDVAPFLSLTFNEPMVPLSTLDQLDVAAVPVEMTPQVDGRWRWIGTRTLRFEVLPDAETGIDRLPAATDYTIVVPAGTESANGAVLADDFSYTFQTPVATVTGVVGVGESMPLDPVFVARFDQRVDPDAIIDVISFESGDVTSVRLATDADLDRNEFAQRWIDQALPGRAVAFVPTATLTPDSAVSIAIGPGIPSLEGPRINDAVSSETGRTYPPLALVDTECGFDRGCRPFDSFRLSFSNPLDAELFDPTLIRVEPAVPGLRVDVSGDSFIVRGATSGNTTYTVSVGPELTDVFGQTLGEVVSEDFRVGEARPFLTGPNRQFVTTDPFAEAPSLAYTSVNHDRLQVMAWQVTPDQYRAFQEFQDAQFDRDPPTDPGWPVVLETTVDVDADSDEIIETVVDLTQAFGESDGPIVVRVEPDPAPDVDSDDYWQNRPILTWVQNTTLGVDAFVGQEELVIWTTDLLTGDPVGNASITLIGGDESITTNDDGLARVDLSVQGIRGLAAADGDRTAMLPSGWFDGWQRQERSPDSRWYVIDDRGTYRPGETVRIAGFVRELEAADAQLALVGGEVTLDYTVFDPQGNDLASDRVAVNALGGFNITVDIPEESNTGVAFVEMQLDGAGIPANTFFGTSHQFQIQDFRTPEFEVTARTESPAPYYVGEPATVAVDAEYFAGGPLPDAEVNWLVSTTDASFTPPNRGDFNFGVWTPWWYSSRGGFEEDVFFDDECFDCFDRPEQRVQEFAGQTNGNGSHFLQIDFEQADADGEPVDQPTTVTADATVFDVNRQAFSSRTNVLVHPAEFYVGIRSERPFVRKGELLEIDAIVADVDGNAIADREIIVTAGRLDYSLSGGSYVEEIVDEQTCTITSSDTDEGGRCEFPTELGGQYQITAIVTDDTGRSHRSVYTQWVTGSTAPPSRNLEQAEVTIVPDAETYAPGDTAELLVQAPFAPASGLVTVTRAGIESTQVFDAPDGSAVVEVPIADDDIPNLQVRIDMVGSAERVADDGAPLPDAPRRPAFAVGSIGLQIPPVARTLDVTATPAASDIAPGSSTSIDVEVVDASGTPVSDAGVVLIAVDEAVLSLSGYELRDPISSFYTGVNTQLQPELIRQSIILANPDLLGAGIDQAVSQGESDEAMADDAMEESASDGADFDAAPASADAAGRASSGGATTPIDVRSNFDALAVFAPDETTGADGTVAIAVDLPDNVTRYRIMAVAVDGVDQFGSGESTLTARLPITVRPSAPRFLNFGDRFELPVVVQNQTDEPVDVDVAIETANLDLDDAVEGLEQATGKRVTIPANDRVEVRFPSSAVEVGTARFRVATASGEFADAAEIAMPVYTPATSEAFATYGVLDGDDATAQPILAPDGVIPQFGGLEISTSSTALQALTDAVLYLYDYDYESADGYASRLMGVAALRDVLDAFDADGLPDVATLNDRVGSDIERLQALQNGDGGFPYWQRNRESVPWVSIMSAHALTLARDNGYAIDENVLSFALQHLTDIESFIPNYYSQESRDAISAYALYVRDLAGQRDAAKAIDLYRRSGGVDGTLQLDSLARLWPVLDDENTRSEIEREIANNAVETPAAATFATSYGEDAYLIAHSDRRTDGIVLGALVSETPDSDLIPKVVTGLLGNQNRGRWRNVYENVFILLSLNEYFDTFESVDPDFIARAWLGDTYAAEAEFRGRSTETSLTTVPMAELIDAGDTNLIVDKDGPGRLYYRLGLRYAPADFDLDQRDEGFVVERVYESVDDPADVVRNDDGSWTIKAGASVRVRLTMIADARRTHVALVDALPAGLEPVNPAFATSVTVPLSDPNARTGFWWWQWYGHQNLRDDRAEAFTSYLPAGTFEYTYVARATTPGEFVVPPTKAEEIYAPEVFGRSASDRVIVAD